MSSTIASSSTGFLPSPRSPSMEEDLSGLIDFSALASTSSRESSPMHLPPTPPHSNNDPSLTDNFYSNLFSHLSENYKPEHDQSAQEQPLSWNFDRLLSPSSMQQPANNIFSNNNYGDLPLFSSAALPNSPPLSDGASPLSLPASSYDQAIPTFGHPSFAIDPQLVAAPAPSSFLGGASLPTIAAAGAQARTQPQQVQQSKQPQTPSEDDEDEEDEDEESIPSKKSTSPASGKASAAKGRKSASSIVQSGGVSKRVTSAVVAVDKDPDSDDWRPSPEEYKKLSSKEKRQLRNKISARNFRVRRKEYITTLESHIADRDRLIEAIREELGASRLENNELRQEVETLKRAMLEGRTTVESLALPPPAPLDANGDPIVTLTPQALSNAANRRLNKPNTRKDLAPGSPHSARGFWGGVSGAPGGGITPVHATFIPDIAFPAGAPTNSVPPLLSAALLSGKPQSRNAMPPSYFRETDNINPLLNTHLFPSTNAPKVDGLMELNPFTIKSAEDFRMHMWAQLARDHGARSANQQVPQFQQHATNNGATSSNNNGNNANLLSALRPAFFGQSSASSSSSTPPSPSSPKSTLAALLSGKATPSSSRSTSKVPAYAYPTPPSSPPTTPTRLQPTQQQAYVAALASQTLMSRLGGAFWDAFSGSSSVTGAGVGAGGSRNVKSWDADKVRRVLEGKAVVRVVDIEPSEKVESVSLGLLEQRLSSLSIGAGAPRPALPSPIMDPACGLGVFGNLRK